MKSYTIICTMLIALCCLWLCLTVQARNAVYDSKVRPKMALTTALALADKALGKDAKTFYCVGAGLGKTRALDGDWLLNFASASGDTRFVDVGFDHHVWVHKPSDEPIVY